ncbi:MAG: polysaccharide deacetylase family protein, partial [Ruminococcus sp.]|nr:polysaccharide deacetylase family protein [Ruminococcus sp.]
MNRKLLRSALALSVAAVMLLTGCGKKKDKDGSLEKTKETTTASQPAEQTASEAETEADADASSEPIERKVNEYDPDKPVIALTFDDGPNTETTPKVLDMLEKYDVVGSFFLIGNNIEEANYDVVKRAYSMGCDIENHSQTHSNFTTMTVSQFTAEVTETDKRIYNIIGEYPKFFRAPYTYANTDMYENINKCFISGYGCNDWEETTTV